MRTTTRIHRTLLAIACTVWPVVATGCGMGAARVAPVSEPRLHHPSHVSTTVDELDGSTLPVDVPTDFSATFGQDGGMAPWFEDLEVSVGGARYDLWMQGVELTVLFTPGRSRIESLYAEVREGRFERLRTVPLGEEEIVYDAPEASWSITAAGRVYRVRRSGAERIDAPATERTPLDAIARFVDLDASSATATASIAFEPDLDALAGTHVTIDLGNGDFGIGDDRWNDHLDLVWSGGEGTVSVAVDRHGAVSQHELVLVDGSTIVIGIVDDGVVVESRSAR